MKFLFIDCDDTLYQNDWELADIITDRINKYTTEKLGLSDGKAYELYRKHGTCLRGLQQEKIRFDLDDFLAYVHDLPIKENVKPDLELKNMLMQLKPYQHERCIFTASVREHVERCLEALDLIDFFQDKPIIDVRSVDFYTKHDVEAMDLAKRIMNCKATDDCILIDDSQTNIRVAKQAGWTTVLVGFESRDKKSQKDFEYADFVIDRLSHLDQVLPDLFN